MPSKRSHYDTNHLQSDKRWLASACTMLLLFAGSLLAQAPPESTPPAATPAETPAPATTPSVNADVTNLTAEQKQELLRKKEQFDQLSPEEQERLRRLHQELVSDPAAQQLAAVMTRYHEWLLTLRPLERDKLLSLPAEERLTQIKQLLEQQRKERVQQMENVPQQDLDAVVRWVENFAQKHEEQIFAGMPPEFRQRLENETNPERRRRGLAFALHFRPPGSDPIQPRKEDFEELKSTLTKPSRDKLSESKEPGELVKSWIRLAAISNARIPPPRQDDLTEILKQLPSKERSELEGLPPDALRVELTRKYYRYKMGKMKDNYRPGVFGPGNGPFFRPGGDPNDPRDPRRGFKGGDRPSEPGDRPPGEGPPPGERRPPLDRRPPSEKPPGERPQPPRTEAPAAE